jgi:hypothetical protein
MKPEEDIETLESLKRILKADIKRIKKLRDTLQKLGINEGKDLNEKLDA